VDKFRPIYEDCNAILISKGIIKKEEGERKIK
ncbi:unnamed protein product, partial [marine sediment metagenome]